MKSVLSVFLIFLLGVSTYADESLNVVLESAKALLIDKDDKLALDKLKNRIRNLDDGLAKTKAIEVVAFTLKNKNEEAYEVFRKNVPSFDFISIDRTEVTDQLIDKTPRLSCS